MKNLRILNFRSIVVGILLILIIVGLSLTSSGCYPNNEIEEILVEQEEDTIISNSPSEEGDSDVQNENIQQIPGINEEFGKDYYSPPPYSVPLIEGLHVTGTPIEVDIKTYKLKITGLVIKELEFTFDEIKKMKSIRIFAELNCPGFFVDEGYWTGVRISDLLEIAEVKKEAQTIKFVEIGAGYIQELPIDKIFKNKDNYLIAYHYNDKTFSSIHGYPLRIVAKGESGNIWVKWLGEIEVSK